MGRYQITASDGSKYEINADDDGQAQRLETYINEQIGSGNTDPALWQPPENAVVDMRYSREQVRKAQNDQVRGKGGYRDLLEQGVSFGLSDELTGVANYLASGGAGGSYELGRDAERLRIDEARRNTGWGGTAAEIGGGLLGAAPARAGQALLTLGNAAVAGLKGGAIAGGAAGFGSGNGTADSLVKAGLGAVAGSALGGLLPIGVGVVGNRIAGLNRLFGDRATLSRQIVGDAIEADGSTPASVGQRLIAAAQRQTPLSIADTGENTRGLLASVSRRPGPARSIARPAIEQRQAEQSDRVVGAIGRDLGRVGNVRQESERLLEEARTASAPLYDDFRAQPGRTSDELEAILQTPAGRSALSRAQTIAANERRDPTALGFDLNDQGEVILARNSSPETLDLVKRGLDDLLEDARDPITGRINYTPSLRAIEDVRKSLIREADNLYPQYGAARAAFAGPASVEEALQLGRQSLNMSAEDLDAAISRMQPAEVEQFGLGLRAAMADNINRAGDSANVVNRLLGTPRKREALSRAFGGEEGFNNFLATMADEREISRTSQSVLGGSQTAERLAADAQTSDGGLAETAAGVALRGVSQPLGLLGDALKALGEVGRFGAGDAGNQTREGVAALLTETDPSVLYELQRSIRRALVERKARERVVNRTTGKLGAGVGANTGLALGSFEQAQ